MLCTNEKLYLCIMLKLTQHTLEKLEELYGQAGYTIRNEKGNFKSGSCLIEDSKTVVLNKFSPVEAKITFLIEALQQAIIDESLLDEKNKKFFLELKQTTVNF